MSEHPGQDALIGALATGLRPVRPLAPPWRRTLVWCGAVLWVGALVALFADMDVVRQRLMATPDMGISFAGAAATCVLAAGAAFTTSVPGRSARWALLPLPALAVWVGASTAGCMRMAPAMGTELEPPMHAMSCVYFIILVAMPLAGLLMWQIMRACPLRPALTASLAGLASAGAAACILTLVHPFDATAVDLLAHLAAFVLVVGLVRVGAAVQGRK